jgi:protoporphyrinogen oxidase
VFGKGIAEKYMLPYNEKIWNISAELMAIDWVEGRIPRPPVEDVIKSAVGVETEGNTHQLYFGYPKTRGIEALPGTFARECESITTGFYIKHVRRDGTKWIVSDGNTTKSYDGLVSTIPIQDLVEALPDVHPEIRNGISDLGFNSLIVVMIGAVCRRPVSFTALYVPSKRFPFHRLSFPLNFTEEGAPPGHFAVTAEITTNPGDGFHELDDEAIVRQVIDGLVAMDLLKRDDVTFERIHRTKHVYVVRTFDYHEKLSKALNYLSRIGIVSVGRNAEFEYINMDEAVRRGLSVAKSPGAKVSKASRLNTPRP